MSNVGFKIPLNNNLTAEVTRASNAENTLNNKFTALLGEVQGLPNGETLDTMYGTRSVKIYTGLDPSTPPMFSDWMFIQQFMYDNANTFKTQVAYDMNGYKQAQRYCRNNVWSDWKRVATETDINAINENLTWKVLQNGTDDRFIGTVPQGLIPSTATELYCSIWIGGEEWYCYGIIIPKIPTMLKNTIESAGRTATFGYNYWDVDTLIRVSEETGGTVNGSKIQVFYR